MASLTPNASDPTCVDPSIVMKKHPSDAFPAEHAVTLQCHTIVAGHASSIRTPHGPDEQPDKPHDRRFHVVVTAGPAAGTIWRGPAERCAIGSHPSNDLVLDDATVSRFHCELT